MAKNLYSLKVARVGVLAAAFVIVSCSNGTSSNPLSDGSGTNFLITSEIIEQDSSKWFCSVYDGNQYVSRTNLEVAANGDALFGERDFKWVAESESSLVMFNEQGDVRISGITFTKVRFNADQFTADLNSELSIACDWSGKARAGEVVFNDVGGLNSDTSLFGEISGVERLLITSLNNNRDHAYWSCLNGDLGSNQNPTEYKFFAGSRGFSVQGFEWAEKSEDEILIIFADSEYGLKDITFSDDASYEFTAMHSEGYPVSCSWMGPPRAGS